MKCEPPSSLIVPFTQLITYFNWISNTQKNKRNWEHVACSRKYSERLQSLQTFNLFTNTKTPYQINGQMKQKTNIKHKTRCGPKIMPMAYKGIAHCQQRSKNHILEYSWSRQNFPSHIKNTKAIPLQLMPYLTRCTLDTLAKCFPENTAQCHYF